MSGTEGAPPGYIWFVVFFGISNHPVSRIKRPALDLLLRTLFFGMFFKYTLRWLGTSSAAFRIRGYSSSNINCASCFWSSCIIYILKCHLLHQLSVAVIICTSSALESFILCKFTEINLVSFRKFRTNGYITLYFSNKYSTAYIWPIHNPF